MLIQNIIEPKKSHRTTLNAKNSSAMVDEAAQGEEDVEEVEGDQRKAKICFLQERQIMKIKEVEKKNMKQVVMTILMSYFWCQEQLNKFFLHKKFKKAKRQKKGGGRKMGTKLTH